MKRVLYILGAFETPTMGGYALRGSEVWNYDPGTDTWTRKNDSPIPAAALINATGLINGEMGYVFGTQGNNQLLWEYNPQMDSWRQLVSIPTNGLGVGFRVSNRYHYGMQGQPGGSVQPLYRLNMANYPNP